MVLDAAPQAALIPDEFGGLIIRTSLYIQCLPSFSQITIRCNNSKAQDTNAKSCLVHCK